MAERKNKRLREEVLVSLIVLLVLVIAFLAFVLWKLSKKEDHNNNSSATIVVSSDTSNENNSSTNDGVSSKDDTSSENETPSEPEIFVTPTGVELDADFGRLLLINGDNPLPDDYDQKVREYLVEIDPKYRNNDNVTQIHKDVYPYITAMVAAAQADGVDLRVWSPFRDYATQKYLFQNQVNRVGGDEEKAATVVARPGTSEHNTGLCADFNMASDRFESTQMYTWMCENAEDYGFILRYPKKKQSVTGVIYESWHWRFVGINNAKEINELGITLEEFIEMKEIDPNIDMYGDDSRTKNPEQIVD